MEIIIKANMITENVSSLIDDALEGMVKEYVDAKCTSFDTLAEDVYEALADRCIFLDNEAFENVLKNTSRLINDLIDAQK